MKHIYLHIIHIRLDCDSRSSDRYDVIIVVITKKCCVGGFPITIHILLGGHFIGSARTECDKALRFFSPSRGIGEGEVAFSRKWSVGYLLQIQNTRTTTVANLLLFFWYRFFFYFFFHRNNLFLLFCLYKLVCQ